MTIKKYEAATEEAAIKKAQDDFGEDALILKIQTKVPRGFVKLFKKPIVEVTAACKEKDPEEESRANLFAAILGKQDALITETDMTAVGDDLPFDIERLGVNSEATQPGLEPLPEQLALDYEPAEAKIQHKKIEELENKINDTEQLLKKVTSHLTIAKQQLAQKDRRFNNTVLQLFYDTLVSQGTAEHIAGDILKEAEIAAGKDEININLIVKIVYNIIINILGVPEEPFKKKSAKKNAEVYAFIGPTGVGKTTTIAKLASILVLRRSFNLALVTADTYRIAAVAQLRTYADILGIEVDVVYKSEDLPGAINRNKKVNDVVFLDTAGRSHKNAENMEELKSLLSTIPGSEKFLVLSLTTKYETLIETIETYSRFTDFNLIFTKADEAEELGAILNVCYLTGKKAAYIATGQNVPDDIEMARPEKIAKSLLGLGGDLF